MAQVISPSPMAAPDPQGAVLIPQSSPSTDPLTGPAVLAAADVDEGCALFEFILKVVLIGVLCLLGFAGNTLSLVVLWRDRGGGGAGGGSAITFLLQAVLLADLAVIWMLFIRDVVPALGYVLPLLSDCTSVCDHVAAVTRPLLFLARACVVWLMLQAAASRYLTLSRPSSLQSVGTVDCARRQVVLTLVTAFVLAVPLTFDSVLHVLHVPESGGTPVAEPLLHNRWYRTIYLYVIQFALLLLAPLLVVVYMSARLLQLLRSMRRLRRVLVPPPHQGAQSAEMTQIVLTLCITLLVCYLPLTVLFVLEWAQGQHVLATCGHLLYYLQDFANMFLALNSSVKVLILALFMERFGPGIRRVFCGRRSDAYLSVEKSDSTYGMYKCQDMSEMTLISQVDGRV